MWPSHSSEQIKFYRRIQKENGHIISPFLNRNYNKPLIEETNRVYKPSYTIEFNREGEVLLYSCEPTKEVIIFN